MGGAGKARIERLPGDRGGLVICHRRRLAGAAGAPPGAAWCAASFARSLRHPRYREGSAHTVEGHLEQAATRSWRGGQLATSVSQPARVERVSAATPNPTRALVPAPAPCSAAAAAAVPRRPPLPPASLLPQKTALPLRLAFTGLGIHHRSGHPCPWQDRSVRLLAPPCWLRLLPPRMLRASAKTLAAPSGRSAMQTTCPVRCAMIWGRAEPSPSQAGESL